LKETLQTPVRCGGWCRIVKLTASEARLDVKAKPVALPRGELQLSPTAAQRWTVVPAPKNAPRFPATWGPRYAVCPNCRDRARLEAEAPSMRCDRCNGLVETAGDEPRFASA